MSVTRRAHPTGNVTWRAKVFFEGRVIAQRLFGRRVDAKRWEADQLAKLDAGSWIAPARGRMTFAALAEEWPPRVVTWRCAARRPRGSCWTST